MLILTRRIGESLIIGNNVTITVLGVKGNQVRVGVNAPKEVSVHREEIYERIQKEKSHNIANANDVNHQQFSKNNRHDISSGDFAEEDLEEDE